MIAHAASTERPTTVAWATDIHLDHVSSRDIGTFADEVAASGASALLLGGDISIAREIEEVIVALADEAGLPVHFVLGNHDYYGGSIHAVRARVGRLVHPRASWLPAAGPRDLAPGVALVGHGGWGDARLGDFAGSGVVLTDYMVIEELRAAFDIEAFDGTFGPCTRLRDELRRLGREAADCLAPQLHEAAAGAEHVVVLTHVPPFREACWYDGRISDDNYLPAFTCGAVGELLREAAAAHPACRFTVLCGHTHGAGVARIADNLTAHTQGAVYGAPTFMLADVSRDGFALRERP